MWPVSDFVCLSISAPQWKIPTAIFKPKFPGQNQNWAKLGQNWKWGHTNLVPPAFRTCTCHSSTFAKLELSDFLFLRSSECRLKHCQPFRYLLNNMNQVHLMNWTKHWVSYLNLRNAATYLLILLGLVPFPQPSPGCFSWRNSYIANDSIDKVRLYLRLVLNHGTDGSLIWILIMTCSFFLSKTCY